MGVAPDDPLRESRRVQIRRLFGGDKLLVNFAIGNDQCGNYWCVDLTRTDPGIWFYDHDPGRFDLRYATIQAFADELLSDVGSWNRERGSSGSTVGEAN